MKLHRSSGLKAQRGMVMFVALGVLIIMTLAGLAMLRQMGGSVSIAGNIAFKQNATAVGDLGTEAARAWMTSVDPATGNARVLTNTQASAGYYSSWGSSVDPTSATFPWSSAPTLTEASTGNTVQYVIHRLCKLENVDISDVLQQCSSERDKPTDHGGGVLIPTDPRPYYRITTKVMGPRNTVSYIQVVTS